MDQSEISREMVMARYFELDSQIALIQGRHKQELEPLQEELRLCALFVKDTMIQANEQSVKINGVGQTYFTTKSRAGVEDFDEMIRSAVLAACPPVEGLSAADWNSVLDHISRTGLWTLLTKAASKETVKEYVEAHGTPPPGVNFETYRDLAWRRGR